MPVGDGGVDHGWPKYGNPNAGSQQQAQYNQAIQQLQEALQREQTSNQTIQTLQAQCQQLIQQGQISNQTIQALQAQIQQLSQKDQTKDINLQELSSKINDLIEENKHPYDKDLLKFSQEGDVEKSAAALLLGANIEATNSEGQTPLFLSLMNGHLDVVNVLLDLNANVDVTDKNNRSIVNMLNDLISSHIKDHNLPPDLINSVKGSLQRYLSVENKKLEALKLVPNDHLVIYYPFKENAFDESHHGNDGEVYGATLVSDRFGSENSAYYFDGNSYITSKVEDFPRGERTISLWFKPEIYNINSKTDRGGTLFGYSGIRCNPEYNMYDNSTNLIFGINRALDSCPDRENNYDAYVWGEPIGITCSQNMYGTPSIWNHLVLTSNNTTGLAIYLNGEKIAQDPRFLQSNSDITDFAIGSWVLFNTPGSSPDDPRFRGSIDEVRVYDRCLNEEEVEQLYKEPSKESVDALSEKITQISSLIRLIEKVDLKSSNEIDDTVDINSSAFVKNEGFYKSNPVFFKQPEIFSAEENEHPYSNKM